MAYIPDFPSVDAERQREISAALASIGIAIAWLLLALLAFWISWLFLVFLVTLLGRSGARIKPDGRKAILITGGTSGIGLAVGKHLYRLGFTVIVGYYNDQEPGYRELVELSVQPGDIWAKPSAKSRGSARRPHLFLVQMDVTSTASVEQADVEISKLLEKFDLELYALINNAGIALESSFEWTSMENIKRTIDTNLSGTMFVTRQFLPKIIRSQGKVVSLSSGLARYPGAGVTVYGATKSAIGYFSDALGEDLHRYGVKSVSIHPANLITNSNILLVRARSTQRTIEGLSEEERELYKDSVEGHTRAINRMLRIKFENGAENQEQLATVFQFQMPSGEAPRRSYWRRFIDWTLSLLDGRVKGKSIEESGVLTAFEDAVLLKRPPGHLFAGTRTYSLLFGPLCEHAPPVVITWFGKYMLRNMFEP